MKLKMSGYARTGAIATLGIGFWMLAGTSRAACLQKTTARAVGPTYVFMLAPEAAVAGYVSLGFSRITCPSDMSLFRKYLAQICGGNGGVPQPALNTDMAIGVPRARACADAQAGLVEAGG